MQIHVSDYVEFEASPYSEGAVGDLSDPDTRSREQCASQAASARSWSPAHTSV